MVKLLLGTLGYVLSKFPVWFKMHIFIWDVACVFRQLPPFPTKLVSSSSHCLVMRTPLHVRLVELLGRTPLSLRTMMF